MNRRLWPAMLLAAVSFASALYIGLRTPPERRPGAAWAQFELASLRSISLKTPKQTVELTPLGVASAWVKLSREGQAPQEFLTGERTREVYFALSPLWATRVLGSPSAKKRQDYGLDEGADVLQIQIREGGSHVFQIGKRGFQSSDYFVLDRSRSKVFLWNRTAVDLLSDPARMALKELSFFNPEGLNRALIYQGTEAEPKRQLIKTSKLWREKERSIAVDDPLLAWLENLSRLALLGYESKSGKASQVLLRMKLETESAWNVQIVYDPSLKAHFLELGGDKPRILLDSAALQPLLDVWAEGTFPQKDPT